MGTSRGRSVASIALLAAIVAALAVLGAGCGSSSSRSSSSTPGRPGAGSTTSVAAVDLSSPGAHAVADPPLTTQRTESITYTQAGDGVLAWGPQVTKGSNGRDMFVPRDLGALLDPHTLRWAKLPVPALAHPTSNAKLSWVAHHIVLVGNSCAVDPNLPADDAGDPNCPLGPVQAAVFDPQLSHWRLISVPDTVAGYLQYGLVVGDAVLVATQDPNSANVTFSLLDPTAGTWTAVPAPPLGKPEVICASNGTAFAVNVRVNAARGWTEAEGVNGSSGDQRYGQVQVSSLAAGATAWSSAGPVALSEGAQLVSTGCVGGGVLVVATASADHTVPPGQTGAWLSQPGTPWVPVAAPPASSMQVNMVGQMAATPLDGDRVSIDATSAGSRVFDGTTRQWSTLTALPGGAVAVGVHVGGSELARTTDGHLVAVTP